MNIISSLQKIQSRFYAYCTKIIFTVKTKYRFKQI